MNKQDAGKQRVKMHVLAAVLAIVTTAAAPVEHWYTEDPGSRTCTTLETAYSDMGAPHTPAQLLGTLRKLGRPYEMGRNDGAIVILPVPGTNFSIPIFSTGNGCNDVLQEVPRRSG